MAGTAKKIPGPVEDFSLYARDRGPMYARHFQQYVQQTYGHRLSNLQAGIFAGGNPFEEARGDPAAETGKYKGLFQWSDTKDERFPRLVRYAGEAGWKDWRKQLEFAADEMFGKEKPETAKRPGAGLERESGVLLLAAKTPEKIQEAAQSYLRYPEGGGNKTQRKAAGIKVAATLDAIDAGKRPEPRGWYQNGFENTWGKPAPKKPQAEYAPGP